MPLILTLAQGVLTGIGKHPSPTAPDPAGSVTMPLILTLAQGVLTGIGPSTTAPLRQTQPGA